MLTVTCAIIENGNQILCAQRSNSMDHPMKWEFPGGKQEGDENLETCLQREIEEELGIQIIIIQKLPQVIYHYGEDKIITLVPFRCKISGGKPQAKEHKQVKWLTRNETKKLDWLEADISILSSYLKNVH